MTRMTLTTAWPLITFVVALASSASAQRGNSPPYPTSPALLGAFDAAIAVRAARLIATPGAWNRHDARDCPDSATSWSIRCAMENAADEELAPYVPAPSKGPTPEAHCDFHLDGTRLQGGCGAVFDRAPGIFSVQRIPHTPTGEWRSDMTPTAVWAGTLTAPDDPVVFEAQQLIDSLFPGKYRQPLIDFNNDSTVSASAMQRFFTLLAARVRVHAALDLGHAADSVEIDGYAGGNGVIRTAQGWFPVSGIVASGGALTLRIYADSQVSPSSLDRRILVRAEAIITSDSLWNRADNRKCPATATTWSIYCSIEKAEVEVTGGFHHRRPAMEVMRILIDEKTKDRQYHHRLMDYNNDKTTTLADVRAIFAEAIAKIQ